MSACPDDETLAAYAEHRAADAEAIEEHLDGCEACRIMVAHLAAVAVVVEERELDPERAHQTMPMPDEGMTEADGAPLFGAPLARGAHVDRYVVDGELGRGGMGIVLLAHDPQLARTVALKIVRPGTRDASARAGLLREARAMARLSHPNVAGIHDVGELDDGRVFLAMEHVRGTTLRGVLADENRPLARTLDLFVQAGRGLAAAHAAGLIHRDFKPENVLVGDDGRVRVTDFGLARGTGGAGAPPSLRGADVGAPPSGLSGAGAIVGTPAYMAPEQTMGCAATPASDQFAFAVALFEALTHARPFAGATFEEIARAKIAGERRPWPARPVVPADVREIVDRAMSLAPEDRYPSMNEVLALLERARGGGDARRRGRSRVAALASVLAVGAIAAAAAAIARPRSAPPSATATAGVACVDGGRAMNAIWGDARRSEVRAALAAKASVPVAVDEALATLDRQAADWTAMHDASCAATRDGLQADAVYRLRAACLRRRWNELVETIDVLAHETPDPDDAFEGEPLGSVRACADVRTLAATEPLPSDPVALAHVEDLYARIAHARAASAGTWTSLDALSSDVAQVRWAPALAEHALLGAELAAAPSMDEAVRLAEASRDDELVARARRVSARKHMVRGDGAFEELASALAAVTKLERPDLRADVLEQRAAAERELGRFAAALTTAREAQALRDAGAESPRRPRARWTVDLALVRAEAALETDDLAAAREALAALEPVTDDAVRAARMVLVARVALAEGRADAALPMLADARTLAAAVHARVDVLKSTSRERRAAQIAQGALFAAMGSTADAELALGHRREAERAAALALHALSEHGYGLAPLVEVRAVVVLGRLQRGRAPASRALARAKHAFEVVAHMDPAPIVAEALVGLGEALVDTGDTAGALARLTRAEVLARDAPLRLRVACAAALLGAAQARGADPTARPRAVEVARRTLAEARDDTPGRAALQALLAREP